MSYPLIFRMVNFNNHILSCLEENKGSIVFDENKILKQMYIYVKTNTPEYSEVLEKLEEHLNASGCHYLCSKITDCDFTTICINSKNYSFGGDISKQVMYDIKEGNYSITLEDGTEIPFVFVKRN